MYSTITITNDKKDKQVSVLTQHHIQILLHANTPMGMKL